MVHKRRQQWLRGAVAIALLLVLSAVNIGFAGAQERPAPRDPVVLRFDRSTSASDIAKAIRGLQAEGIAVELTIGASAPTAGTPTPVTAEAWQLPNLLSRALRASLDKLPALAVLPNDFHRAISTPATSSRLALALILSLVAAGIALGVRAIASRTLPPLADRKAEDPFATSLRHATRQGLLDLGAAGVFALVLEGLSVAFRGGAAGDGAIAWQIGKAVLIFGAYTALGRVLFDAGDSRRPLVPVPHPTRNRRFLMGYGALTALFVASIPAVYAVASERAAAEGWVWLCGMAINLFKIYWFWTVRKDLASAIRAVLPAGATSRILAVTVPAIGVVLPVFLMTTLTVGSISIQRELLASAGIVTQLVYFLVPVLAGITGALAARWASRFHGESAYANAARRVFGTLGAGAVLVVGLIILRDAWQFAFGGTEPLLADSFQAIAMFAVVLLIGWSLYKYLDAYFAIHAPSIKLAAPGEENKEAPVQHSRLATVLPLLRAGLIGLLCAVIGMLALSSLGISIAPLLAGAGIVGLAISFGSQALVRDIVSGIFFMADDAFRIGEYIDTGRLKGSVERLTIRALQLRHQNGQIHTIPYGQLTSVTNFSRDWQTVKFNLRLDRNSDLELVRKRIKQVGQELLSDSDIGSDFILPVKMQGLADIVENAFVVRVKFTAKPARPAHIQRVAIKSIYSALTKAGVRFATNGAADNPNAADAT